MSIIPANIDYVKMAQMVSFSRYLLKRIRDDKLDYTRERYLDEMEWTIDKISKILDDGIPPHTLKAVKGSQ